MLDTIRALNRQLKLKSLMLSNFVPLDGAALIERRAVWNDEKEDWDLPRYPTYKQECIEALRRVRWRVVS